MNLLTVIIAILVFLAVIWILVAVLLYARKKLVPEKKVKVHVNKEKSCDADYGTTLLQSLSDQKIYVPSACGGGGTCGTCKGIILSGGGDILPTEKAHIDHKLEKEHYRLFCQVKVKNEMEVELPPEILGVKKWECEVVHNKNVATYIKELVLKLPDNEKLNFRSGSYIQIDAPKTKIDFKNFQVEEQFRREWEELGIFDQVMKNSDPTTRAYSLANPPADNDNLVLNVRIALPPFNPKKQKFKSVNPGIVSSYIFALNPGDKVMLSGPYGDFFLRDTNNEKMFIGGGAGMAPLRSHIFYLFKTLHFQGKTTFWYGGRSLRELFYREEFDALQRDVENFSFHVALSEPKPEDQWNGNTGFIHQVIFEQYLKNHPNPEDIEYYICGPPLMLQAVRTMLDRLGVPENMILFDDFGS